MLRWPPAAGVGEAVAAAVEKRPAVEMIESFWAAVTGLLELGTANPGADLDQVESVEVWPVELMLSARISVAQRADLTTRVAAEAAPRLVGQRVPALPAEQEVEKPMPAEPALSLVRISAA